MNKVFTKKILGRPQSLLVRPPSGLKDACVEELHLILNSPQAAYKYTAALTPTDDATIIVDSIDMRQAIEMIFRLSTARHVYLKLAEGHVGSLRDLRKFLVKVPWQGVLHKDSAYTLVCDSKQSKVY